MNKYIYTLLLIGTCLFAASPRQLINQGNELFGAGDYQSAIAKYNQALLTEPENQSAKYNLGVAQMKANQPDEALKTFNSIIAQTSNKSMLANARRNVAALKLQEGFDDNQIQDEKDIEKRVDSVNSSIEQLQRVKDIAPEISEPANQGIEAAKLRRTQLEQILEQIEKERQDRQQASDEMKEELEELEKQQNELSQQSAQSAQSGDSQDMQAQQAKQEQLTEQTQQALDKAKQSEQSASFEEAKEKMEQAIEKQKQASEKLSEDDTQSASELQKQAAQKLKEASEAISGQQYKSGDEQGDHGNEDSSEQSQGEEQGEDDSQEEDSQRQDDAQQESELNDDQAEMDSTAQDILDKERQNKKLRKEHLMQQRKSVEKDW